MLDPLFFWILVATLYVAVNLWIMFRCPARNRPGRKREIATDTSTSWDNPGYDGMLCLSSDWPERIEPKCR